MDLDMELFGESSGTTVPAVQTKRVRHKWTSAFRVMQSLHRLKNPPVGTKSEVCFLLQKSRIRKKEQIRCLTSFFFVSLTTQQVVTSRADQCTFQLSDIFKMCL